MKIKKLKKKKKKETRGSLKSSTMKQLSASRLIVLTNSVKVS
jgi:hypothetical protein